MFENYDNPNARYERMYKLYQKYSMLANDPFGMMRIGQLRRRFEPLYFHEMDKAHKRVYPRRRIIKYENVPDDVVEKVQQYVEDIGLEFFEDRLNQYYRMQRTMKQLAPHLDYTPDNEMRVIKTANTGTYATQGYGANKYALKSIEPDRLLLERKGFTAEIRSVQWKDVLDNPHKPMDIYAYELWANTFPYILHALTFGYTILEWATSCWKSGVNPKVYDPFLSDDVYEQSLVDAGFSA